MQGGRAGKVRCNADGASVVFAAQESGDTRESESMWRRRSKTETDEHPEVCGFNTWTGNTCRWLIIYSRDPFNFPVLSW